MEPSVCVVGAPLALQLSYYTGYRSVPAPVPVPVLPVPVLPVPVPVPVPVRVRSTESKGYKLSYLQCSTLIRR